MPDKNHRAPRHKKPATSRSKKRPPEPQTYSVHVEDNFNAMVRDASWTLGTYATYDDAVEAAKGFVERYLKGVYEAGMTTRQLLDHYATFGDKPFIVPPLEGKRLFLARNYAAEIADDICSAHLKDGKRIGNV